MMDSYAMEQKLKEAFALVSDSLMAAGYPECVRDAYELVEAGESAVALENMCDNLYEFECRVPVRAYELIAEVGIHFNVNSRYWKILEPLVVR